MKDIQRVYFEKSSIGELSTMNHLIGGAVAGAVATTATNPMDVVKTRLQTQSELPIEDRRYKGVIDAFFKIARFVSRSFLFRFAFVTLLCVCVDGRSDYSTLWLIGKREHEV
jgi:hypothetical protein